MGITVKARTRVKGTEESSVTIFANNIKDRKKLNDACHAFACYPWIAVYIETSDNADIYITSLNNYDDNYSNPGRVRDEWYMKKAYKAEYANDDKVKHIHIEFESKNWMW